jgi:hypothetical protein
VLIVDDFNFIITTVANVLQDILQKHESKHEDMYERFEVELRGVQQALQFRRALSTAPPPSEEPKLGDEPAQLCRLADVIEAHLRRAQAEKDHATMALKQAQEEMVDQHWVTQKEKDYLQANFKEERAHAKQGKEQLLPEQLGVKEVVDIALHSMMGLEPKVEDQVDYQVA